MTLAIASPAPPFSLQDQEGKTHSLADYRGKPVLVYFYPKDDTPGCTKEACGLRDQFAVFRKLKAAVVGISADSVTSHKKFAEKYHLPFPLLSDESRTVINAYGAWGLKKFMGKEFEGVLRKSFLVDEEGNLLKIYDKVNPEEHAAEVLRDLEARGS
jgi:peroxiredoxin Q/BCP